MHTELLCDIDTVRILWDFIAYRSSSKVTLRNNLQVMVHSLIRDWRILIGRKTPTHRLRLTYTSTLDRPSSLVETAYAQASSSLMIRMMTMMMMMTTTENGDNVSTPLIIVTDSATIRSRRQQLATNFLISFYIVNTMFYTVYFLIVQILNIILGQGVIILC